MPSAQGRGRAEGSGEGGGAAPEEVAHDGAAAAGALLGDVVGGLEVGVASGGADLPELLEDHCGIEEGKRHRLSESAASGAATEMHLPRLEQNEADRLNEGSKVPKCVERVFRSGSALRAWLARDGSDDVLDVALHERARELGAGHLPLRNPIRCRRACLEGATI